MQRVVACLLLATMFMHWPASLAVQAQSEGDVAGTIRERLSTQDAILSIDGVELRELDSLRSFYEERSYLPTWMKNGRFEPRSREVLSIIRRAEEQGLPPRLYHARAIESISGRLCEQYSAACQADMDLLLSDALLAYSSDLLFGLARRIDARDSAIDSPEDINIGQFLTVASSGADPREQVRRLMPVPSAYRELGGALPRLRELARQEKPFRLPGHTLHPGDTDGEIVALRRRLAFLGDLPAADNNNSDAFDPSLVEAVKHFQSRHGLEVDGVVGHATRAALEVPLSKRIEQIELNLERWRWLPRDPGWRYLIVNIAGQDLKVVENDQETLSMRVIVGKPFQRTPSFTSNIEAVVLNPYWEVPHSIATNEILPILRKDRDYLERERMDVLRRVDGGGLVDPTTIDWQAVKARNFPYRFRQRPGPNNALGRVKFLLPNPYSVYLHDTPAKSLFSRSRRCFSHGCVRLERPFELANLLLQDERGWSFEKMEKTLKNAQNYRISLKNPMPVYLVYWTAWVDENGTMHFRDDVYGRDKRLRSSLKVLRP